MDKIEKIKGALMHRDSRVAEVMHAYRKSPKAVALVLRSLDDELIRHVRSILEEK